MEDLFREMLAPLPPASPSAAPLSLPLPNSSATQAAGEASASRAGATASQVTDAVARDGAEAGATEMVDYGMGMGMDMRAMGMGGTEQWATNDVELQKILETLGQSAGYDVYHQQSSNLELELGWEFGTAEGIGMGIEMSGVGVGVF